MIVHEYRSGGRGLKVAVSAFEGDDWSEQVAHDDDPLHLSGADGACWLVTKCSEHYTAPVGVEVTDVSLDDDGAERRTTTIEPRDLPLLDLDLRIVPVEVDDGTIVDGQTGEAIPMRIARAPRLGERLTVVEAPSSPGNPKLAEPAKVPRPADGGDR